MSALVAALPMYDWPERRAEVDAEWTSIRDRLRRSGIAAPDRLARRNGDLPAVPGGIRDAAGNVVAPDPASLPPDEFDLPTLWRHPGLLLSQTCWGPLDVTDLASRIAVLGQPDYARFEGGSGPLYSSAIVMRAGADTPASDCPAPANGAAALPLDRLRGARLAFNDLHSRSGRLGLQADLEALGEGFGLFSALLETGGHRLSIRAIAAGQADVATIDCRSWVLARLYEPAAAGLRVVGWTGLRMGLPYISAIGLEPLHERIRAVLDDRAAAGSGQSRLDTA